MAVNPKATICWSAWKNELSSTRKRLLGHRFARHHDTAVPMPVGRKRNSARPVSAASAPPAPHTARAAVASGLERRTRNAVHDTANQIPSMTAARVCRPFRKSRKRQASSTRTNNNRGASNANRSTPPIRPMAATTTAAMAAMAIEHTSARFVSSGSGAVDPRRRAMSASVSVARWMPRAPL